MKNELKALSKQLKDTVAYLDSCINWADTMSAEAAFEEYIKKNYSDNALFSWQKEELKKAYKAGFIIGVIQQESGKFEELKK